MFMGTFIFEVNAKTEEVDKKSLCAVSPCITWTHPSTSVRNSVKSPVEEAIKVSGMRTGRLKQGARRANRGKMLTGRVILLDRAVSLSCNSLRASWVRDMHASL